LPVDEKTRDLPANAARVLGELVQTAVRTLGETLRSIVLFGSAAENRLRSTSDINVLIVVTRFDPARVDAMHAILQQGHAAVRLAVMWLSEQELPSAGESFAVKFADIARRHRVLHGSDPFQHFRVSRQAAIVRLRQVLLNLVLRLRASYALERDREERITALVADAAGPLRASAAEILDLQGAPAPTGKAALESLARDWSAAKAASVLDVISRARETRELEPGPAAAALLDVIDLASYLHGRAAALS
jgi:hypothetical protein